MTDTRLRRRAHHRRFSLMAVAVMLLAALSSSAGHAASPPGLDPRSGFVMPADRARDLLRQCSRNTPQGVQGTWLPDAAQIRELEAALPQALAKARQPGEQQVRPGYGRQYGGIVLAGRKYIYVNAFPASVIDFDGADAAVWAKKASREAVTVCDGGPDFFGAVYDPASKTFRDFAFNGFA